MKGISDVPEELRSIQRQSQKKTSTGPDDLFKKTFEKAISGTEAKPMQKQSLPPLGEINAINFNIIESPDESLSKKTSQLLNKLDHYTSKLKDPKISLREIEPLISEIKEEAARLSVEMTKNSSNNSELVSIADQSALSASIEHFKFMRGDYLSDT